MSFIKKTVSALLCAVLVASSVLVFAACGKNNNNNTENSTTKSNNANVTNVVAGNTVENVLSDTQKESVWM